MLGPIAAPGGNRKFLVQAADASQHIGSIDQVLGDEVDARQCGPVAIDPQQTLTPLGLNAHKSEDGAFVTFLALADE